MAAREISPRKDHIPGHQVLRAIVVAAEAAAHRLVVTIVLRAVLRQLAAALAQQLGPLLRLARKVATEEEAGVVAVDVNVRDASAWNAEAAAAAAVVAVRTSTTATDVHHHHAVRCSSRTFHE